MARTGVGYGQLTYTYNNGGVSNQVSTITGTNFSRAYSYDENGNATSDGSGLAIDCNILNLPNTVKAGTVLKTDYIYTAAAEKLSNTVYVTGNNQVYEYIDGIAYLNGNISFIQTPKGQAIPNGGTYQYIYDLKDEQGNVLASIDQFNGAIRVVQQDAYYAFGLRVPGGSIGDENRYTYNGKEEQKVLANQYDYGARFYDPVIARWTSVDPLAEKGRRWSPYVYGDNNPIRNIDPDGMETQEACDPCNVPSEQDITGNKRTISENNGQKIIDGVTSAVFTLASIIDAGVRHGQVPNSYSFDYSSGERTFVGTPITSIGGLTLAVGGSALDLIAAYPAGGPAGSLLSKTPGAASSAAAVVKELSPFELQATHGLTQSKKQFANLKAAIKEDDILEPIKYVENNGVKSVVDGHHRLRAAKELGHKTVPAQQVLLPYGAYKTTLDLIYTRY